MSPHVVRRANRVPSVPGVITHADIRLLVHMADVADDRELFWESRERTSQSLSMHPDQIKRGLGRLIRAGYVEESRSAVKGKRTRGLRLLPEAWPTSAVPAADPSMGARAARAELARAAARSEGNPKLAHRANL